MKKYILGLFTGIVVIPVTEEFLNVVYSWIEVAKTKPAGIVNEWNKKMMEDSPEDIQAIGFQVPTSDEEYYEDGD